MSPKARAHILQQAVLHERHAEFYAQLALGWPFDKARREACLREATRYRAFAVYGRKVLAAEQ